MYQITRTTYGYKLVFGDVLSAADLTRWFDESKSTLALAPTSFGVLIDMRTLKPLGPDAGPIMMNGQAYYRQKGMKRSAVILESAMLTLQFKKVAKDSGIASNERYIDASETSNWESVALAWIENGVEPDA
jgi:hypothetical protein